MQISRQQAESVMRGILGQLPEEYCAKGEFAEKGLLIDRITFANSPVTVELHEVVRAECYAIIIYNTKTSRPAIHKVWMLGRTREPLNHPGFCPARREVTPERHGCKDCQPIERVWDWCSPQEDGYADQMVAPILSEAKFALTLC